MRVSTAGRAVIQQREGLRLEAYRDSAGVWTIGFGATWYADGTPVKQGDRISPVEAERLLDTHLTHFADAVDRAVTVSITQSQFDALVSLALNIGTDAFARSTLLRKLNSHDIAGAANEFLRWNRSGGRVVSVETNPLMEVGDTLVLSGQVEKLVAAVHKLLKV